MGNKKGLKTGSLAVSARSASRAGPYNQRGSVRASHVRRGNKPLIGGLVGAVIAMTVLFLAGAVLHLPLVAMLLVSLAFGLVSGSMTGIVLRAFVHAPRKQGRTDPAVPSVAPTDRPRAAQRPARKARSYIDQHGTTSNLG